MKFLTQTAPIFILLLFLAAIVHLGEKFSWPQIIFGSSVLFFGGLFSLSLILTGLILLRFAIFYFSRSQTS